MEKKQIIKGVRREALPFELLCTFIHDGIKYQDRHQYPHWIMKRFMDTTEFYGFNEAFYALSSVYADYFGMDIYIGEQQAIKIMTALVGKKFGYRLNIKLDDTKRFIAKR